MDTESCFSAFSPTALSASVGKLAVRFPIFFNVEIGRNWSQYCIHAVRNVYVYHNIMRICAIYRRVSVLKKRRVGADRKKEYRTYHEITLPFYRLYLSVSLFRRKEYAMYPAELLLESFRARV